MRVANNSPERGQPTFISAERQRSKFGPRPRAYVLYSVIEGEDLRNRNPDRVKQYLLHSLGRR